MRKQQHQLPTKREAASAGDVLRDPLGESAGLGVVGPVLRDPLQDASLSITGKAKKGLGSFLGGQADKDWARKIGASEKLASWSESLGEESRTKEAAIREENMREVGAMLQRMNLSTVLARYHDIFMAFLRKEWSHESLMFLDDLDAGVPDSELIARYVRDDSELMLNVSSKEREAVLREDSPRPCESLRNPVLRLLHDPLHRFRRDPDVLAQVADQL